MSTDDVLQTFVAEARELLLGMEDSLLALERDPRDGEAISATFRAIHTIKGSAGLFSLDQLVAFAHVAETLLDLVRDGRVAVDGDLIALLLECSDYLGFLINQIAGEEVADAAAQEARRPALLARLQACIASSGAPSASQAESPRQAPPSAVPAAGEVADPVHNDAWHISLRFGPEVLKNGMDPASFLRYLGTLGEIAHITTLWQHMPAPEAMDAESCYLGFELDFRSEASREAIDSTFDFVRDDCRITLLPPRSSIDDYLKLIAEAPEGLERLGEILVASGALSQAELERALERQGQAAPPALGEMLIQEEGIPAPVVQAALEKQAKGRENRSAATRFIRVDAEKLEELINQVGELVIAGASATLLSQRNGDAALIEAMAQVGRHVEEIRDRALSLRMVEIGESFNRFPRVVRDVSRELGKDIELVITGAETELDKTVVEKIGDPLMHLVRNSMDHGIESIEERLARGKPAQGRLSLHAYHESGSIVIEVADDGGGLKRDKILAKAMDRGLVAPGQALTDRDVFNLIFEPGFSTAEQVTNLSGRGVGMDVVRRNISALRGSIDIESQEGVGTTMRIRLPLTLAIIDGFLIQVADSAFVLPLDLVQECMELPDGERLQSRGQSSHYLDLRGEALPCLRLRNLLNLEGESSQRENVVIVQYGNRRAGLVVDRLLGEFQTVIKPLGQIFRHLRGFSGSTILGTGEVALILDVQALAQIAIGREERSLAAPSSVNTPRISQV
ncbi:chemotaxis protein CheW [Azospira sp. APE16]|uniref:chemotaxis protein CheA n=1 Tax=Azospira sp. APE16 TaxID=3394231 RepID=UPI003A4DBF7B